MYFEYEYFIVVIMILAMILFSLKERADTDRSMVIILPSTSHIMKAVCCIFIILHHWAFRVPNEISGRMLTDLMGGYSLSVFFMLSTYGIAKSEMKHPLRAIDYARHRIWKILKPYMIVVLLILVVYWLIGATYPIEDLKHIG